MSKRKKNDRKAKQKTERNLVASSMPGEQNQEKETKSSGSKTKKFKILGSRKSKVDKKPDNRGSSNTGIPSVPQSPKPVNLIEVPKWININEDVSAGIEKHAYSILDAEVGGMLFGQITSDEVAIVGFVPARNASVDQISLTFTHDVWDDILAEGNNRFPGSQIVGWYHTHPSFGLFLSEYDSFIQRNFFSSPKQLALVIDPISGHLGWFANGPDETIETLGVAETLTGPAKPQVHESSQLAASRSQNNSSSRVVIAVAGASIVSGLIGAGISSANAPVDLKDEFLSANQQLESILYGDNAFVYLVQTGDTWDSVRKMFFGPDGTLEALERDNPDLVGKELVAGSELVIYAPNQLKLFPGYMPPVVSPTPVPTSPSATPTPEATSTVPETPIPSIGPPMPTTEPTPMPTN